RRRAASAHHGVAGAEAPQAEAEQPVAPAAVGGWHEGAQHHGPAPELGGQRGEQLQHDVAVVARRRAQIAEGPDGDAEGVAGERLAAFREQHAPAAEGELDALGARRPEGPAVALAETGAIGVGRGAQAHAARRGGADALAGRQLELAQRRDDPEAGAEVERQGRGVEALVHEAHLRRAWPGALDATLDEAPADAAPLEP